MSEQAAIIGTVPEIEAVDTATVLGVKCVRVKPASWREVIMGQLEAMMGPRPRMAVIFWDGSAFQFRNTNPPQRIVPE